MRIGYYGGTFDPPHNGHLAVACAAADAFALDRVLVAPTGVQPLKSTPPQADFRDRLAMVELLCRSDARLEPSTLDGPTATGAPNYTVDALTELRATLEVGTELFTIVGADAFAGLPRWHDFQRLLTLTGWIVVSRPGFDLPSVIERVLPQDQRPRVHLLDSVDVPVSATRLRTELAGDTPAYDLPPEVLHYIRSHHLYGT